MMQFGASIWLGVLPLAVFGLAALATPSRAPIAPAPVQTEGITARRMDEATFRRRWPTDLPPATVIHEMPVPARVTARPPPPPARIVKRASLRTDVCARHGLRRVTYTVRGYQHWRCRR